MQDLEMERQQPVWGLQMCNWLKSKGLIYLAVLMLGMVFVMPFYWLVTTSLKGDTQLFKMPPVWIPKPIVWNNYSRALNYIPFGLYLKNTLIIAIPSAIGIVLSTSLVGYGFAKIAWPGRDAVFFILICTMMLPYQVVMIPLFIVFTKLGWVGTFKPLIVPSYFAVTGAYVFLFRQFFMTIPTELSDIARIDGCTEFGIYRHVMIPLSKPVITTVVLFGFMGHWNDFLAPLIYLEDDKKYTLALGLQQFQRQFGMEWSMLMAASVVMALPIIVLFFLTQKTFVQSIALTGLKG